MNSQRFATRFLTAALLGAALTFAPSAMAKSCKSGSCGGGPNAVEATVAKVEAAKSTVSNASLEVAYDKVKSVHKEAAKLGVENTKKVKTGIEGLANTVQERANGELVAALEDYSEGQYKAALAVYERLAKLEGLPAAKKAKAELKIEPDRVTWRELKAAATQQVASADYLGARDSLRKLSSLSRRTGYTKEQRELTTELAKTLSPRVESATASIEKEQFESAYTTLIEISRISEVRTSSMSARKALTQNSSNPGMRQAKAEYDSQLRLDEIQDWIAQIAHPSPKEMELYRTTLDKIATDYNGTEAAKEAKRLLDEKTTQQARS